ncbi:LATE EMBRYOGENESIS ABUNDANT (LEA) HYDROXYPROLINE-RICH GLYCOPROTEIN FAMILY [Salix viminalis]|uniref:LATE EMBRYOGENESIS ABUNDANT (LEA) HYDROXYPROLINE-RICH GLYCOPROTEIN FAMILY n=1 Tax=Salix viminalis TaxID=40686 RepID=A0A9Q0NSR8_SALVM|nr:LATE EMBRYOGENESIS ABUNDANT (LEA) HYDROXYPROLINE-RICH GLYCOPROTEIN FAMILY [Salix viminalis]
MNLVLKLGLLQFHDVLTEESEFNIVINGRQTNEASSPKTTRLQRPQSPGKICPETATYKEDIRASFTPAKEKKVVYFTSGSILNSPFSTSNLLNSRTFRVTKKSDGTYLTAKMVARIEVRNPNEKIMYHFGVSEVGTTMGDEEVNLGSTSLPKFTQEKGNATSLKTVTSVKSELVEDRIGSAILNQFKNKKLKVKMNVRTRVGISVAGMKTGVLGVEVLCGGVTLKETESGEMPRCVMKILKWIIVR